MDLIITCPKCGASIDVSKQMTRLVDQRIEEERSRLAAEVRRKAAAQVKEQIQNAAQNAAKKARSEEATRYEAEKKKFQTKLTANKKEVERLRKEQEARVQAIAKQRVKTEIEQVRADINKSYREKIGKKDLAIAEYQDKLTKVHEEATRHEAEKRKFQNELTANKKEIERLRKEQEARVQAIAEQRVKTEIEQVRADIDKSYMEKIGKKDLAIAEYQDKLKKVQGKVQELEAKVTQGSAQTRGILAEDGLFKFLKARMPTDRCQVEKRGQGMKGTDVIIHILKNEHRVGALIIDDKWANEWGRDWPEKVWGDMQMHNADFAYIAVNASALPEEIKTAGFGLAPCRRAGVRVWTIDRNNLYLVLGILMDSVDKVLRLAEIKDIYGATSKDVKRFQAYLTKDYEIDLRTKAKHMSVAVKALNELHKKVNSEYQRALEALEGYWTTEERVHRSITACFAGDTVRLLPQVEFTKER